MTFLVLAGPPQPLPLPNPSTSLSKRSTWKSSFLIYFWCKIDIYWSMTSFRKTSKLQADITCLMKVWLLNARRVAERNKFPEYINLWKSRSEENYCKFRDNCPCKMQSFTRRRWIYKVTKIGVQLGTKEFPKIKSNQLKNFHKCFVGLIIYEDYSIWPSRSSHKLFDFLRHIVHNCKNCTNQDAPHIWCISLLSWIELSFLLLPSNVSVCPCW